MTSIPPPPPPPAPQPPAPGWYDDPTGSRQLRYWTGATWSAHVHLKARPKARGLGVVAAAWAVAAVAVLAAVSVAVDDNDDVATATTSTTVPDTVAAPTTQPTTTSTTTSTTTATTAEASSTSTTAEAGIDEATARNLAVITLLSLRVNPQIGESYRANPEGTIEVLGNMADSACELINTVDANEDMFTLGLMASWTGVDEETREFFGGTAEAWGTLHGVLVEWRCPDLYDQLTS